LGWKEGDLSVAENYYRGCISLPIYPSLSDSEQEFVISKILQYYNG
jgi:dTDP-4-amino-4,6-dideoxygalactose transaminase